MKLNEIRAFVTVARVGSIQAAAEQLHMTQSAVSRLVQRLECDLGATLLDRRNKPLGLTPDGRIALEHGQRILGSAEAFADALAPAGMPSGLLRIGTAHALAELVADRPLDLLRKLYPDVVLQVSADWTTPLIEKVQRGELDGALLTLLTSAAPRTDLPARRLGREQVRIIGAAHLVSTRWSTLAAMNEVGWVIQPEGCGYRTALSRALEQVGAGPLKVIVESFGKALQLSVAARGAAFALLPASQVAAIPTKRKIKVFAVPGFQLSVSTWFVRGVQSARLSGPLNEIEETLAAILAK